MLQRSYQLWQYIRGKPHPFGIKAFVLADSQTVHRLCIYFGTEIDLVLDPTHLQTTRYVFTDCFSSSPELAMELERCGIAFTGTVQTNGQRMPLATKCLREREGRRGLPRGSITAYRVGKTMVMQWQDKRIITILSTAGSCNTVEVRTHRGALQQKPESWFNSLLPTDCSCQHRGTLVVMLISPSRGYIQSLTSAKNLTRGIVAYAAVPGVVMQQHISVQHAQIGHPSTLENASAREEYTP